MGIAKFTLVVLFLIILSIASFSFAQPEIDSDNRFSFNFQNEDIEEVFQTLSEITGYEIVLVGGALKTRKTSGEFRDMDIYEILREILKDQNKAISVNHETRTILVSIPEASSGSLHHPGTYSYSPVEEETGDTDYELIPAENPEDDGVTLSDFQKKLEHEESEDIGDYELIPAENPEDDGVTLSDFQKKLEYEESEDIGDYELAPADDPNKNDYSSGN